MFPCKTDQATLMHPRVCATPFGCLELKEGGIKGHPHGCITRIGAFLLPSPRFA